MAITYRDAGVDVEGGNNFVRAIAPIVKSTFSKNVITDIGGFGALFSADFKEMEEPVLVSGTDGVGTKLQIAQKMEKHDTIGIDAVAMCVNDIITSGASPLFFLDYISCGKLREEVLVDVVKGIAAGCRESECSLVGGETAEHPGVMNHDDYDIAGFAIGVVDKKNIINGSTISVGDKIIALPSSGIHSNGYSLVRKLFFDIKNYSLDHKFQDLDKTLGETLLTPTALYVKPLKSILKYQLKGLVHITGGGFYENIPRILPENVSVKLERSALPSLPIFDIISREGEINEREMFTTFNMGTGMMIFSSPESSNDIWAELNKEHHGAKLVGEVTELSEERVILL